MSDFQVHKSIVIDAPVSQIFETIRNFKTWPDWSPWLIADPDAAVIFDLDDKGYSWKGPVAGSGGMRIEGVQENEKISYDLAFLKPWKSTAKFQFEFSEVSGGTEVTWKMQSSLPFFMFFMKDMMVAMIGMDYTRGLAMLKDLVETGSVPSVLSFSEDEFRERLFVGLQRSCSTNEISGSMKDDFAQLNEWVANSKVVPMGAPFAIYHKWDFVKERTDYTIGYPVAAPVETLPQGFFNGVAPGMKTYAVKHTGPYRHLGNAWSAGIMRSRSGVFKQNKKAAPIEIYETNPAEVPENESITTVHIPMR
ncbi:SRPBCC family protein [Verrucomicrobiales bacterium BCK34]|nr:SRPBCC family protein [Verrucomicrobiales bacterium BCK34]